MPGQHLGDHRWRAPRAAGLPSGCDGLSLARRCVVAGRACAPACPRCRAPLNFLVSCSKDQLSICRCPAVMTFTKHYEASDARKFGEVRGRAAGGRGPRPSMVLRSMIGLSLPEFSRLIAGTSWATILIGSPTMPRKPVEHRVDPDRGVPRRPVLEDEKAALDADQAVLRRAQRLLEAAEERERLDAPARRRRRSSRCSCRGVPRSSRSRRPRRASACPWWRGRRCRSGAAASCR